MSEQQGKITINSAPSAIAKIGDKIFYLNGEEYAGTIEAVEADRFILDRIIKDGSRKAYVLKKNENIIWFVKNDELPYYPHPDLPGWVGVAINNQYGGFPIYEGDRHDPKIISQATAYKSVKIVYIPDYMIEFYTIEEYDGYETCKLELDKYVLSEVKKITKSIKDDSTKMEEIKFLFERQEDGYYPTDPI